MKVFPGLHKTVDDRWTAGGAFLDEPGGVLCRMDDGTMVAVVADGRLLCFDGDGAPRQGMVVSREPVRPPGGQTRARGDSALTVTGLERVLRAGERRTWGAGDPSTVQLGGVLAAMTAECAVIAGTGLPGDEPS